MKTIKFFWMVVIFVNISTITAMGQTPAEYFKTLCSRVQTQGETPPAVRNNLYTDKLISFFNANGWKEDQVISIKEIKVLPPTDPTDWYYFVSVKTKKCITPFYISYDIADSNLGELFIIEPSGFPIEFKNFMENEKNKLRVSDMRTDQLNELVSRVSPIMKKRIQIFIKDTIRPYLNDEFNKSIDTIVLVYPESERVIKKQELWDVLKKSDNYVKNDNWLNNFISWEMDPNSIPKALRETYKTENQAVLEVLNNYYNQIGTKEDNLIKNMSIGLRNWTNNQKFIIPKKNELLEKLRDYNDVYETSQKEYFTIKKDLSNEIKEKFCLNIDSSEFDSNSNLACKYTITKENVNILNAFKVLHNDYLIILKQNKKTFEKGNKQNYTDYQKFQLWLVFIKNKNDDNVVRFINSIDNSGDPSTDWVEIEKQVNIFFKYIQPYIEYYKSMISLNKEFEKTITRIEDILSSPDMKKTNKLLKDKQTIDEIKPIVGLQ